MGKFNRGGNNRFNNNQGGFNNNRGGMFKATCSNCGKPCEVPFRPTNGKPVFCNNCFAQKGGERDNRDNNRDRFQQNNNFKKNFNDRGNNQSQVRTEGGDDLKKQLEIVNIKLDRLIRGIESLIHKDVPAQAPTQSAPKVPEVQVTKVEAPKVEAKAEVKETPKKVEKKAAPAPKKVEAKKKAPAKKVSSPAKKAPVKSKKK